MPGRHSLRALSLSVAFAAIGCSGSEGGGDAPSPPRDSKQAFAGALDGTDAMVAAVQNGQDWLFYVCGGETTRATLTGWFQTRLDPKSGTAGVEATSGDSTIVATPGGESLSGTLEGAAGERYSFEAVRIETPDTTIAGLYSTVDSGCRTGLVVAPDERIQGVWCDSTGLVGQVVPILPIEVDQRGLAVLAGPDMRLLHLLPAIPPLP